MKSSNPDYPLDDFIQQEIKSIDINNQIRLRGKWQLRKSVERTETVSGADSLSENNKKFKKLFRKTRQANIRDTIVTCKSSLQYAINQIFKARTL